MSSLNAKHRLGRITGAAGITTLLVGGVSAGVVLAAPATAAFAATCTGTQVNLTTPGGTSNGTACYTVVGSNVDVTVDLASGTPTTIFVCYAQSAVNYTNPSQCAGSTDSMFEGQATPQGGIAESTNPANFTLAIVSGTPTPGAMQVAPGDYVYLHVSATGGTVGTFGEPYVVPSPNGVPVANPTVVAGMAGVAAVGGALFFGIRRRRATVSVEG